ncbi:MAG: ABC transporter permease [Anaerolineales bacterium]|jgi:putative ABC transport system permease protein|nr:ABC transporter permease [Anaerolineales bacterium]
MNNFFLAAYLSWQEIWRNRGRFFLVSMVIALITLLVLFIAALGEGLGNANRQYISRLDSEMLVFLEKSDYIIPGSRVERSTLRSLRRVEGVADAGGIATSSTAILLEDGEVLKVSLIGVEPGRPGDPAVNAGRALLGEDAKEAVVDLNVLQRSDVRVGDLITVRSTQGTKDQFFSLRVVGATEGQLYTFQPSIFVPYGTWDRVRAKSDAELDRPSSTVNVAAVRLAPGASFETVSAAIASRIDNVEAATIQTAIENVPGYSAQQGTVQTQAVFTLLIGVLVIGGFFQIQILQKVPQIGVLKAIGASNGMVGLAAVMQIIITTTLGVALGSSLAFLFSLVFPPTVPIVFNGVNSAIAIAALLLIGPAGGLVSIFYAVKIEPLKALRLS